MTDNWDHRRVFRFANGTLMRDSEEQKSCFDLLDLARTKSIRKLDLRCVTTGACPADL